MFVNKPRYGYEWNCPLLRAIIVGTITNRRMDVIRGTSWFDCRFETCLSYHFGDRVHFMITMHSNDMSNYRKSFWRNSPEMTGCKQVIKWYCNWLNLWTERKTDHNSCCSTYNMRRNIGALIWQNLRILAFHCCFSVADNVSSMFGAVCEPEHNDLYY